MIEVEQTKLRIKTILIKDFHNFSWMCDDWFNHAFDFDLNTKTVGLWVCLLMLKTLFSGSWPTISPSLYTGHAAPAFHVVFRTIHWEKINNIDLDTHWDKHSVPQIV